MKHSLSVHLRDKITMLLEFIANVINNRNKF